MKTLHYKYSIQNLRPVLLGQGEEKVVDTGPSQADIASSLAAGIAAGILSGGNQLIGKARSRGIFDQVASGISKMSADGISAINDAANKATSVVNSATINAKAVAAEIPNPAGKIGKSAQDAIDNAGSSASPRRSQLLSLKPL